MTDPIADLLTRMRNGVKARQLKTVAPYSKIKISILDTMKKRHFIKDYRVVKNGAFNEIEIELSDTIKELNIKRISKPGKRVYVKKENIKSVIHGYGLAIYSTPQGILSGEEAFKKGVGGEYLCEVW